MKYQQCHPSHRHISKISSSFITATNKYECTRHGGYSGRDGRVTDSDEGVTGAEDSHDHPAILARQFLRRLERRRTVQLLSAVSSSDVLQLFL